MSFFTLIMAASFQINAMGYLEQSFSRVTLEDCYLSDHVKEQMEDRNITEDQIAEVLATGKQFFKKKHPGRVGYRQGVNHNPLVVIVSGNKAQGKHTLVTAYYDAEREVPEKDVKVKRNNKRAGKNKDLQKERRRDRKKHGEESQ